MNCDKCMEQGMETTVTISWFPDLEKTTKTTAKNKISPIFVVEAPAISKDSLKSRVYR